jgi:hypothetical protein
MAARKINGIGITAFQLKLKVILIGQKITG